MYPKPLDRVRHMSVLCTILASRDHLVDKASLLLAKTLLAYRVRGKGGLRPHCCTTVSAASLMGSTALRGTLRSGK